MDFIFALNGGRPGETHCKAHSFMSLSLAGSPGARLVEWSWRVAGLCLFLSFRGIVT